MTNRKRSVWPWVAAVLIGVPTLYFLSFGPACWIAAKSGWHRPFESIYWPIGYVAAIGMRNREKPPLHSRIIWNFGEAMLPKGEMLLLPTNHSNTDTIILKNDS